MKFIKITTRHTEAQLGAILNSLSTELVESIAVLYRKFENVEFVDADGNVGMFAAIHSNYISDLLEFYVDLSVNFKYEDITKEVLYGCLDVTKYADDVIVQLNPMIESFIDSNLDLDIVLDKISDLGRESLTEKDMNVLTSI